MNFINFRAQILDFPELGKKVPVVGKFGLFIFPDLVRFALSLDQASVSGIRQPAGFLQMRRLRFLPVYILKSV